MSTTGKNIKRLREKAGITQDALAKTLGVPRPAVTAIEQGRRRVTSEELARLAKVFQVSIDEIVGLTQPRYLDHEPKSGDFLLREPSMKAAMRIAVPQKNVAKFREVLLYVLARVGAKPNMGETVLYKLLYFIDFDYYEKYEEQLMGATYQRNHFGPTPVEFSALVDSMIEKKELVRVARPYFDYEQKRYLPLRDADLSVLSGRELNLINDVLRRLSDMSARQISEHSHKDVPWLTAEEGGAIAYESVFYRTPEYSVREDGDDDKKTLA